MSRKRYDKPWKSSSIGGKSYRSSYRRLDRDGRLMRDGVICTDFGFAKFDTWDEPSSIGTVVTIVIEDRIWTRWLPQFLGSQRAAAIVINRLVWQLWQDVVTGRIK